MNKNILHIIFLVISFQSFVLKAQDTTLQNIDAQTYKLYTEKNWKELIKFSKQAIDSNIDFYYLRMRLGIAYYEQHRYSLANKHFKKAKEFYNNNIVDEYLYYSYFFGGNFAEAEKLSNNFTDSLKNKLQLEKIKTISSFNLIYAGLINSDYDKLKEIKTNKPYTSVFNRFRDKYNQYFGASIGLHYNPNFSSILSFGYLYQPKTQVIQNIVSDSSMYNSTKQSNAYISLIYNSLNIDWYLAYNFINIVDDYNNIVEEEIKEKHIKYNDMLIAGGIKYNQPYYSIMASTSFSNLNSHQQFQLSPSIYLYPKANKNIVFFVEPTYQYITDKNNKKKHKQSNDTTSFSENNFIFKIGLQAKIYKSLFGEIDYYNGKIYEFNELGGSIVYNDVDKINELYKLKLRYQITKKLSVFVSYTYGTKNHIYYISEKKLSDIITNSKEIKITNQNIVGGVKWVF